MSSGKDAVAAIIAETERRKAIWEELEKIAREALQEVIEYARRFETIQPNKVWFEEIRVVFGGNHSLAIRLMASGEIINTSGNNRRDAITARRLIN